MKLETFFEKFDIFIDTPGGVAKMRELVLDLAVRGHLSERHDDDQLDPMWSDFLTSEISRSEFLNPAPFSIPPEWQWISLSRAADCRAATKVDPASIKDYDWVLDLEDIDGGAGKVIATVTFADRRSLSTKASFISGDVLYGKLRPYLNKVVIADSPGFCTTEIIPLRPEPFVVPGYLRFFLRSPHFLNYAAAKNYGMKMPRLGTKDLESANVSLPPLAEQKRIVAKVDELMALCDRLEAQQQERKTRHAALARASMARFADAPTPANLNFIFHKSYDISPGDLRKSILSLAVQGRLVPQDPNDESAQASTDQVSKESKKAIREGSIRRYGLGETPDDSDLSDLPLGWRWTRLVEVTRPVPNAIKRGPFGSAIRKDMFVSAGYKIYEQQHAISGDFTKGRYYINKVKFDEMSAFELNPGEVLVSCSGTIGKVAIVPAEIERGIINQALLKLSLHQTALLNEYFLILFPAFFMETDTLTKLSGTAQKNIPGMDVLKAMPFPLPPLAEQRRIVAKVEQLMSMVDEMEVQLAASRATGAKLLSAIVAEMTTMKDSSIA